LRDGKSAKADSHYGGNAHFFLLGGAGHKDVWSAAAKRGDGVLPGVWAAAADRSGHRRAPPAPLLSRLPLRLPDAEQGPSPYSSSSPPLFLYPLSVALMPHIDPCLMWFRFPWRCRRS